MVIITFYPSDTADFVGGHVPGIDMDYENQNNLTVMLVEATSQRIALEQADPKFKTLKDVSE